VMGTLDLEREWRADPFLDAAETLEPDPASQDDYRRTDGNPHPYDRGHFAPLASFNGDRDASSVDFYSNIVPQVAALNQGPWQDLEAAVRNIVCTGETVWVMTGPLYENTMAPLPLADEPHTVPSGFWKIVVGADGGGVWVASFAFDQDTPRDADIEDHLVSVDDLEGRTGLDFLRELPDGEEGVIEGTALQPPEWAQILPDRSCPAPVR